jgi:hypothetical protein
VPFSFRTYGVYGGLVYWREGEEDRKFVGVERGRERIQGVKRCKNASYVSMKMVQRNPPTSVGKRGE